MLTSIRKRSRLWPRAAFVVVAVFAWCGVGLRAQLPTPPNAASQFDLTGFLQAATLNAGGALAGGTLTVNGHVVIVPANTIVILPANALPWQELFALSPAPYTGVATGLASADVPTPMSTYEVHVVGNKVAGTYIAGLVNISQQGLNQGQGYINFIDYNAGEIFVGGNTASRATGARVRINDPFGRYGRINPPNSTDNRFTLDPDNPTIKSETGFPMCLPRLDPAVGIDPLCPQSNRPLNAAGAFAGDFTMNPPGVGGGALNPLVMAPFEVGDYVTFAGTLINDGGVTPTAGPMVPVANQVISAHTISDNIAIYTAPGTNPAYVSIDVSLMGTGGVTIAGATEAAARTRFEGFTTDPSRIIHLYGIDFRPDGTAVDRDWGRVGVDPGPAGGIGAVKGRWRFRPPCTAGVPTDGKCTPPPTGVFDPPPREVRAVLEGAYPGPVIPVGPAGAGGTLITGQYHAPIGEYIFPEQVVGAPVPPANFEVMAFLAAGGYASTTGVVAPAQLNPWPGDVPPVVGPQPPVVVITAPTTTVKSGGTLALTATVSQGTAPFTFAWTASQGTFVDPTLASVTYQAPNVAVQTAVTITATVRDANGLTGSNTATITINSPTQPTVTVVPSGDQTMISGGSLTFRATCSDPNVPAITCNRFTFTQLNAGQLNVPVVVSPNPQTNSNTLTIRPILGVGITTQVIRLSVTTTNAAGVTSAPVNVNVTVLPIPDQITLATEYRTGKQRLLITATTNVISPNVQLMLQPYVSITGATVDPGALGLFVNTGGGIYTLDLVGAPEPAVPPATPLVVTSNLGGNSGPTALQRIRQ